MLRAGGAHASLLRESVAPPRRALTMAGSRFPLDGAAVSRHFDGASKHVQRLTAFGRSGAQLLRTMRVQHLALLVAAVTLSAFLLRRDQDDCNSATKFNAQSYSAG
jgi:hypothetical protein